MSITCWSGRGHLTASVAAVALAFAGCASGGGRSRGATAAGQSSAAACTAPAADPAQVVDANRPAQEARVLEGAAAGMCLSEILERLGPAQRYAAGSVFQFEWKATDGRTYQVGIPSLRDRAVYTRWSK